MNKRLVAGTIAGVMAMSMLAGCGSSSSSTTTTATSTAAGSTATAAAASGGENMTLIMSQRDEFLSTLENAANDQAKEMGITLTAQDAQSDVSKQLQYIETAVNAGEAAVIVNLVDAETGEECIQAAGDLPIVFVNRAPSDITLLDKYENASLVASDEMQAGGYQAEYLAEYFKEKGQTDIKYILVSGILGQVSTTNRTTSAVEGLKEAGINAEEVTTLVCDYDRAEAQTQISPLLGTEEFDCVISNNDAMALGVIEAMKSADIDPSSIPIVGVDCTPDGAQAVKDGEMYMTVFQNPVGQGAGAVIAAKNMIDGKAINDGTDYELSEESESIMWIPFEPVTKDNVDEYM